MFPATSSEHYYISIDFLPFELFYTQNITTTIFDSVFFSHLNVPGLLKNSLKSAAWAKNMYFIASYQVGGFLYELD
jgi:hypothetical protein